MSDELKVLLKDIRRRLLNPDGRGGRTTWSRHEPVVQKVHSIQAEADAYESLKAGQPFVFVVSGPSAGILPALRIGFKRPSREVHPEELLRGVVLDAAHAYMARHSGALPVVLPALTTEIAILEQDRNNTIDTQARDGEMERLVATHRDTAEVRIVTTDEHVVPEPEPPKPRSVTRWNAARLRRRGPQE